MLNAVIDLLRRILDLPPALLSLAALLAIGAFLCRPKRVPPIPWFRKSKTGTVYLFRSSIDPTLHKLGYTGRTAATRQKELEAKLGSRLILVAKLRTPHAWNIEQRCHAALRARGWAMPWHPVLGREWYRFPDKHSVGAALRIIEKTSGRAERVARFKRSWPLGAHQDLDVQS